MPLLLAFAAVCAGEVVVGVMLLAGAPGATGSAYARLPFEAVFWAGFALPYGPPVGLARTVLLLA